MTVSSTVRSISYTSLGVSATFSYPFYLFLNTHIQVSVLSPANVTYPLTLSTDGTSNDYTVTGTLNTNGGSISLVNRSQAWMSSAVLTAGWIITLERTVPLTQVTNVRGEGRYNPEIHENEYDLLVMADQQIQAKITAMQQTVNLLGYLNFPVLSSAPTVPTTGCNVYAISNAGKGQLLVQFPTGAAIILSREI